MNGEIRSGLISPVVAHGVGYAFGKLEETLIRTAVIAPEIQRHGKEIASSNGKILECSLEGNGIKYAVKEIGNQPEQSLNSKWVNYALSMAPGNYVSGESVETHALRAAIKEVEKGKTKTTGEATGKTTSQGAGGVPGKTPSKSTSKDPNQSLNPEETDYTLLLVEKNKQEAAELTKGTQEYRMSAVRSGMNQTGTVPPQSSEYRVEDLVVDPFTGSTIPTAGDTVRTIAKTTIWTSEQYQALMHKYPNLEKLMPAIRVGVVTSVATARGFTIGGPPVALAFGTTALISSISTEITTLVVSHAVGKEMGAALGHTIEKVSSILQKLDPTMIDTDATACATGLVMTGLIASDIKGFSSQIKAAGHGAKVNSSVLYKDTVDITKSDIHNYSRVHKDPINTKPTKLNDSDITGVKPTALDSGPIKPIYGDNTVKIGKHEFPVIHVSSMEKLGKPTKQAPLYEAKIAEIYKAETPLPNRYNTKVDGISGYGVADFAYEGKLGRVAVEAKYIDKWDKSPYNPNYIKDKPFLKDDTKDVLAQARKYQNSTFHEVVYHTNSPEFVAFYKDLFDKEGLTKIRFVISPVEFIKK